MKKYGHKKTIVIVAGTKKGHLFSGEENYYQSLMESIEDNGGTGCVFPLSSRKRNLKVYYWNKADKEWIEKTHPRPQIVYNRFPYRELEGEKLVSQYFKSLKNQRIPYFNDTFFHKGDIADLFKKDPILKNYYPLTSPLSNESVLWSFVKRYPSIFIKDTQGAQGRGIWKIEKNGDEFHLYSQRKTFHSLSFSQLNYLLEELYKSRSLLIQRGISITEINNIPYDFRVLMHFYEGSWILTGLGARIAGQDGFTTHVPQGGRLLPMEKTPIKPNVELVSHIGQKIGLMLQKNYQVREFSFDIGIDKEKKQWVLDVNSKPMSFDEEDIQKRRVDILTKIFLFDS